VSHIEIHTKEEYTRRICSVVPGGVYNNHRAWWPKYHLVIR